MKLTPTLCKACSVEIHRILLMILWKVYRKRFSISVIIKRFRKTQRRLYESPEKIIENAHTILFVLSESWCPKLRQSEVKITVKQASAHLNFLKQSLHRIFLLIRDFFVFLNIFNLEWYIDAPWKIHVSVWISDFIRLDRNDTTCFFFMR